YESNGEFNTIKNDILEYKLPIYNFSSTTYKNIDEVFQRYLVITGYDVEDDIFINSLKDSFTTIKDSLINNEIVNILKFIDSEHIINYPGKSSDDEPVWVQ